MKIFVPHSSSFDFRSELYIPIRNSPLNRIHEFILPQEKRREVITKDIIRSCDMVLAEVSHPSTGQGIELGWASILGIPIICIYKSTSKYSQALHYVTDRFIAYSSSSDLLVKVEEVIKGFE